MSEPENKQLTIKLDNKQLAALLLSLLEQGRSIEKLYTYGTFDIDRNWISSFLHMLDQRIQQNNGQLATFSASVYFRSGKIIRMQTKEMFSAFNDLSKDECIGVEISISYLVVFSETPEKQQIYFNAFSDKSIKTGTRNKKGSLATGAEIRVIVSSTNYTFGEDMYRNICSYIESDYKYNWVHRLINGSYTKTGILAIGALLPFLLLYRHLSSLTNTAENLKQQIHERMAGNSLLDIGIMNSKLDAIISFLTIQSADPSMLAAMAVVLILMFTTLFFDTGMLSGLLRSFVTLNNFTEKLRDTHRRRISTIKAAIFGTLALGAIASLVAARIDKFFFPG